MRPKLIIFAHKSKHWSKSKFLFKTVQSFLTQNKVYIYHGRNESKKVEPSNIDHVQVLTGSDDSSEYFGYSITAADIDQNGYSDIAVGSLRGGVKIFRSRPIIDLDVHLSSSRQQIKLDKDGESNKHVKIDFCFGFTERSKTMSETIQVQIFERFFIFFVKNKKFGQK